MTPELDAITLANFRSISTPVKIPLDAPVVLIHGQNGNGKTSILSGIELALTGGIPSLERVDSLYKQHLVNKDAENATVRLSAHGLPGGRSETTISISQKGISGIPLLSGELARMYSERCYLAQSSLGRLLEIYQGQNVKSSSSPLTLFVKELLGLDVLESLVEGLYDAGDVRRVRNLTPAYSDVERKISDAEARLNRVNSALNETEKATADRVEGLQLILRSLEISATRALDYDGLIKELDARNFNDRLLNVARARRDLFATLERLQSIEVNLGVEARTRLEEADRSARERLEKWRKGPGEALKDAIRSLLPSFPTLPSPESSDPEVARGAALHIVETEIQRYSELISRQARITTRVEELRTESERLEKRLQQLHKQMADQVADAGSLAQALTGILPHIHSEECPVCGRDYREVSQMPLVTALSMKVNALSESAALLEALSRERTLVLTQSASLGRELDASTAAAVSQVTAEEANTARARLQIIKQHLDGLAADSAEGSTLIENAAKAARQLSYAREADAQLSSLIETVQRVAGELNLPFTFPEESLSDVVKRLLERAEVEETSLSERERQRTSAVAQIGLLISQENSRQDLLKQKDILTLEVHALRQAKERADSTIDIVRGFSKKVLEVRTSIVQRVFNESLNRLWADLFIRLAPEEEFVPAFALPRQTSGAVEAVLETIYKRGQRAGNPQTMLSAGNLNTAALTLFLALHLSLAPKLPWLLIDDPVQSMDEVHIAQFAALLRTLSKRLGRRIVIAIHERPLFEYLALELSPAFSGDKLITVELGRNAAGDISPNVIHHIWQEDRAISAA